MDIWIGVPVLAQDGEVGRVERIILHPATREVDGIVAVQGGLLPHDVVIPIDLLETADEDAVCVRGTVADVCRLIPFSSSQFTEPPADWIPPVGGGESFYLLPASPLAVGAFVAPMAMPLVDDAEEMLEDDDIEVSGTTTVYCTDGVGGRVERVLTEGDTDHVTHMVIQRGEAGTEEVTISVERVVRMDADGVHLDLSEDEMDSLPALSGLT